MKRMLAIHVAETIMSNKLQLSYFNTCAFILKELTLINIISLTRNQFRLIPDLNY